MGSSYISNHIHVVFSTKNRVRSIKEGIQPKLWAYMSGIAKNHGMHAVKIGGIEDHVHLLINLGGALGIIKAVQLIKANSSRWMNERRGPRFEWQGKDILPAASAGRRCQRSRSILRIRESTTGRLIRKRNSGFC